MLLSGKIVAKDIYARISEHFQHHAHAVAPKLVIIQVGDDPASIVYVRNKVRAVTAMNFIAEHKQFSATASSDDIRTFIQQANNDASIHGILLQLPLPKALQADTYHLVESISADKDVDGLTTRSLGQLASNAEHYKNHIPCTALAIIKILEHAQIPIMGSHAVVVGSSNIVGRPCALALLSKKATVTVCHSKTRDLASHVRAADILIVAIGNPKVIQLDWLHKDQVVIDVGINRNSTGNIIGDIPTEQASAIVKHITPVPGGVGPMTVACLVHNLYHLYRQAYHETTDI